MHRRARRASAVSESGAVPAAAPSPPEWTRGASSRGGHGDPHARTPRVSRVAMEVSSLGGATPARESPFGRRRRPEARTVVSSVEYDAITDSDSFRQLHFLEKRLVPGIVVQPLKVRTDLDIKHYGFAFLPGAIQPLEGTIVVAKMRV
jgi:hypothetical protein